MSKSRADCLGCQGGSVTHTCQTRAERLREIRYQLTDNYAVGKTINIYTTGQVYEKAMRDIGRIAAEVERLEDALRWHDEVPPIGQQIVIKGYSLKNSNHMAVMVIPSPQFWNQNYAPHTKWRYLEPEKDKEASDE